MSEREDTLMTASRSWSSVRRGQRWREKSGGGIITVQRKAANGAWLVARGSRVHRVHEGTLRKFFMLDRRTEAPA